MSQTPSLLPADLLEPSADSPPAGRLLRTDEGAQPELRDLLDLARTARGLERTAENSGEDPSIVAIAEWNGVREQALKILAHSSKDLEVACILIESLVRTDGFAGIAEGFELLGGLVRQYWEPIFERTSAAEHQDADQVISSLVRPIEQLNVVLVLPIARISLTSGSDAGSYALWQYEQAQQDMSAEEREQRKAINHEQFVRSVNQTAAANPRFFAALAAEVSRALEAAKAAETALDDKLPAGQSPSLAKVRDRLDDIQRCLNNTAGSYLNAAEAGGAAQVAFGAPAAGGAAGSGAPGEIGNREQAFRELSRIADFFARTEPLSLLAEQIREVVRRGALPADKYYSELIDNEDALKQFFRLVGVRAREGENAS